MYCYDIFSLIMEGVLIMLKAIELAKYLIDAYEKYTEDSFNDNELRLQKLMYYIQRESLAITGKPLFEGNFEGWVHGPVLPELRFFFESDYQNISTDGIDEKAEYIVANVLEQYAQYAAWTLRNMSHDEECWIKSRQGLSPSESGDRIIPIEDIKIDASKVRIYDHVWGMYIDEFEDDESYN